MTKVYGRRDTAVRALRDVTLSIRAGAFTAIMGPSGSGKSTLLHCLAALDTPTAGRIFLGGTELTALSRRQQAQVRRDRIGFVFQAFNLVPTLTTLENITLPQRLAGRRPDRDWLDHVVSRVGLGDRLHHRPSELSGGQQQRVALARALAGRPEVIFADEPTGNLDSAASREMLTLLRDAVDRFGQTVVTVTHDPAVSDAADHIVLFTDGQVVDRLDRVTVDDAHVQRVPRVDHAGDHTSTDATPQPDGPDTMRSRRRRQSNKPTPGRPMVGTDDEVEVARQERWLQRIREQFEAEDDDAPWADTGHPHDGPDQQGQPAWADTDHPQHQTAWADTDHQTAWADTDHPQHHPGWRDTDQHISWADTDHQTAWADTDHPHGQDDRSWTDAHGPVDGAGWLPAARVRVSPDPAADRARPPVRGGMDAGARFEEDQRLAAEHRGLPASTEPSHEFAPWSRPHLHDTDEPATTHPPIASPWTHDDDPWAPADRHKADRYRDSTGQFRRTRDWAMEHPTADPGADQTTDQPLSEPTPDAVRHVEHAQADEPMARPRPAARFDRWSPQDAGDGSLPVNGANGDSTQRNGHTADVRSVPWHPDGSSDDDPVTAWDDRRDDTPPHTAAADTIRPERDGRASVADAHQPEPDADAHHADTHQPDPVHEADTHQPDPAAHTHHADAHQGGTADQHTADAHVPDPDVHHADARRLSARTHQHDDVDPAHGDPQTPSADRTQERPPRGTHQGPTPDQEPNPSDIWVPRFDAIWSEYRNGRRVATPAPDPVEEGTGATARPRDDAPRPKGDHTERHPDDVTSRHDPAPVTRHSSRSPSSPPEAPADARRSTVPPALASLRSTRRPDDPADPLVALQSLQDQLERLQSGRRRPRRPRRPGTGTAERSERR